MKDACQKVAVHRSEDIFDHSQGSTGSSTASPRADVTPQSSSLLLKAKNISLRRTIKRMKSDLLCSGHFGPESFGDSALPGSLLSERGFEKGGESQARLLAEPATLRLSLATSIPPPVSIILLDFFRSLYSSWRWMWILDQTSFKKETLNKAKSHGEPIGLFFREPSAVRVQLEWLCWSVPRWRGALACAPTIPHPCWGITRFFTCLLH